MVQQLFFHKLECAEGIQLLLVRRLGRERIIDVGNRAVLIIPGRMRTLPMSWREKPCSQFVKVMIIGASKKRFAEQHAKAPHVYRMGISTEIVRSNLRSGAEVASSEMTRSTISVMPLSLLWCFLFFDLRTAAPSCSANTGKRSLTFSLKEVSCRE